jgi:hypothetical protein
VAVPHAWVLVLAMIVLLFLPAIVAMILCADELVGRAARALHRRREIRRQRRALTKLDRAMGEVDAIADLPQVAPEDRASIQQIAADLHRLGRQRLGVATRSRVWQTAVSRAYDEQLRAASHCLGIEEHLESLTGMDLEIERVRVEGELQAAGLKLPTADAERHEPR